MADAQRLLEQDGPLGPIPDKVHEVLGITICARSGQRWALTGVNGVILESVKVAGRRLTTAAAVRRFVAATQESHAAGVSQRATR